MLAESEYRHELELDIEPFKGLLLGLFFIAVGMSVDLGLFLRSPLLVLGLAFGIVVLKMALLYAVARPFYCGAGDAAVFAVALSQAGEFAFVLFAAAAKILPPETIAVLNAAVAVSMLTTPLLVLGYMRFLRGREERIEREPDPIHESNPVIVAGFGRFGQVAVRVLRGLGIGTTVIDHDPAQIDTVRRFGFKAYYGDATRMDLLESRARRGRSAARRHRRSRERAHHGEAGAAALPEPGNHRPRPQPDEAYEYAEMGVPSIREVFGSALFAAERILGTLGFGEAEVERIVGRFREYDEAQIPLGAPHRKDVKKLVALSEQGRRDIAQLLAAEAGSAPKIDQNDAERDQPGGDGKLGTQRLS
jgi:glutathione-regulated potassium-efflux system protein KefB